MSTTQAAPVNQPMTLLRIASFRRTLYLMAAWIASCALTPNAAHSAAMPGWLDAAAVGVSLLLIWLLGKAMNHKCRTEPTNMLLLSAAMNMAVWCFPGMGSAMLLHSATLLLNLIGMAMIVRVMVGVVQYALPEKARLARVLLAALYSLGVAGAAVGMLWPISLPQPMLAGVASLLMFVCTLNMPVDNRYTHKLERFLTICPENEQLRKRLNWVFVEKHRRPWLLIVLEALARLVYYYRTKDTDNIHEDEDNPLIYLCNHGNISGPVSCVLHIPGYIRPWCISYIMADRDEAADYMHRYSFGDTNKLIPKPLKWPVSRLVARISIWAMNNLVEAVPVFRDKPRQLINTFRASSDALASGDQLLIFPENPNAVCQDHGYEATGLGELFSGFAMLAPIYYNRTGKRARFMPMYAHQSARTLSFGHEIVYNPDNDPTEERNRLVAEIDAEMHRLLDREEAAYQQRGKHAAKA